MQNIDLEITSPDTSNLLTTDHIVIVGVKRTFMRKDKSKFVNNI